MGYIEYYFGKDGIDEKISLADVEAFIREENPEGIDLEYKQPSESIKADVDRLAETTAAFLHHQVIQAFY